MQGQRLWLLYQAWLQPESGEDLLQQVVRGLCKGPLDMCPAWLQQTIASRTAWMLLHIGLPTWFETSTSADMFALRAAIGYGRHGLWASLV
mmetsp:Transcript_42105/g.94670  ORF Transcript_42105/g.94670 Transcript_42105/m.94670 type:complete len:91 (+) Transcript_42105:252-524(+)